jgi:hypothetical protein
VDSEAGATARARAEAAANTRPVEGGLADEDKQSKRNEEGGVQLINGEKPLLRSGVRKEAALARVPGRRCAEFVC